MRFARSAVLALLAAALAPSPALAAGHLVAPGETLSGIAAANRISTQALAAANGLSPEAFAIAGTTLTVPAPGTTSVAPGAPAASPGGGAGGHLVLAGETLSGIAAANGISTQALAAANGVSPTAFAIQGTRLRIPARSTTTSAASAAPAPLSGYRVRIGDTLSAIAAEHGVSVGTLAAHNGLNPSALLLAGTSLSLPGSAPTVAQPATQAASGPIASGGRLTASQISSIAAQHGAPASLATAIAWQESGFNNGMVSVANARGIMQVIPSTWDYVQRSLAKGPLDPASPTDNVRAGSLLIADLLRQTGGDEATAIAAYYQGLGSVRRIGMLPETKQYVANVQALRSRFGG